MLAFKAVNSSAEGQNAGICFCICPTVLKSSDLQKQFMTELLSGGACGIE
jgi:hypothetical protein